MECSSSYKQTATTSSLNPYYNGRYSWSTLTSILRLTNLCLNPYYNGRYSWSVLQQFVQADSDYRLNPYYNGRYSWRHDCLLAGG